MVKTNGCLIPTTADLLREVQRYLSDDSVLLVLIFVVMPCRCLCLFTFSFSGNQFVLAKSF
jgi:hypothetical protein